MTYAACDSPSLMYVLSGEAAGLDSLRALNQKAVSQTLLAGDSEAPTPAPPPPFDAAQGKQNRRRDVDTPSPIHPLTQSDLPTGVLAGSAVISDRIHRDGWWQWHLAGVRRYQSPRRLKPGTRPQPVWLRAG